MSLERALELAEDALGIAYPNPTVGAVIVRAAASSAQGVTEPYGGRHGEIVALEEAGERSRGATLFVTMEPCAHHGHTPPCVDAIVAAGIARVVAGCRDPNPEAAGGFEALRAAGVEAELDDRFEARRQNEAWRVWKALGRPFVTYKVAATLDAGSRCPAALGHGDGLRQLVHELRAASDAVAVGMGTVQADAPRLDARDVGAPASRGGLLSAAVRCPRIHARAADRARSTRSSRARTGGRAIAAARGRSDPRYRVRRQGLVDKLLLFVAPVVSGRVPACSEMSRPPHQLTRLSARQVGDDMLLEAYFREP